jgi:hypothetical protein
MSATERESEPCLPCSARPDPWMLTKTLAVAHIVLSEIAEQQHAQNRVSCSPVSIRSIISKLVPATIVAISASELKLLT